MVTGTKQETASPVAMHIGNRMRSLRRLRGMKQDSLAHDVGYSSHSAIAQFENGLAVPSVEKAIEIARVLGVGVGDLLGDAFETSTSTLGDGDGMTPTRQTWLQGWVRSRPPKEVKAVEEFLRGLLKELKTACQN